MSHRLRVSVVLAVAAGGALGGLARYGLTRVAHVAPGSFPWPTFWINVTGSFVIAVILTRVRSPYALAFGAVGICGAYTTFSTFTVETCLLVRTGDPLRAGVYVVASVVACTAAVGAGVVAVRR